MAIRTSADGQLILSDIITIACADELHGHLIGSSERQALEIDSSGVTETDLALVQLILAARNSAVGAGRTITILQPIAPAMRDALQSGGFLADRADHSFWLGSAGT